MHKVAVIGDYDSIYGFSALGLDTFPVTDVTEAAHLLRKIAAGEYAIIYITEMLAKQLSAEIEKYRADGSCNYPYSGCKRKHGRRSKRS